VVVDVFRDPPCCCVSFCGLTTDSEPCDAVAVHPPSPTHRDRNQNWHHRFPQIDVVGIAADKMRHEVERFVEKRE
jgi:hypothetical protein